MEDKALCPHCGGTLHRKPYLMARQATENVLSGNFIAWFVCGVSALVVLGAA